MSQDQLNKIKNKARQNYLRYREYFLKYYKKYYQENQSPQARKYPYCVLCGLPNQNKRFKKTCSLSCSLN